MPGIRNLRRIQWGKEATPGTPVVTTALWRGTGTLQDDTLVVNPSEDIGVIMDLTRAYIPSQGGTLSLDAVPATYEQLPLLCAAGIKNLVTGVADGAGTGKIYTYPFPTTTPKPTIKTLTLQAGDDQQVELAYYAFVESLKISGKVNAAVEVSAVMKTRTVAPIAYASTTISFTTVTIADSSSGFPTFVSTTSRVKVSGTANNDGIYVMSNATASTLTITGGTIEAAGSVVTVEQYFDPLTPPAVEEILFQKGKLYIDGSTATAGTTQKSNTMLSFELDYKTGWKGQPAADGRLDFSFTKLAKPTGTLKVTFEHDGSATAEKAAWRAKTPRLVRLIVTGSTLATAGTTYAAKTLIIDILGVWTKFSSLKDDNGNDTVEGTLMMGYDSAAAQSGQIIVVNALTALT